jgi:hypothetical protein
MTSLLSTFLACVVVLARATAHADDKADAAKLFDLGKRHYNVNELDDAILQFKAAYKVFPDPVYLFNIAQAYRLKGNAWCGLAAQFYATYQREEQDKKLRDSVKKRREDMEACAKKHPQKTDPPPPPPPTSGTGFTEPPPNVDVPTPTNTVAPPATPTTTPVVPESPTPDPDPNRIRRTVGIVLIGVGVAALGFSLYYASEQSKYRNELDGCDPLLCDSDRFRKDVQNDYDRATRSLTESFVTGLATAGFGAVLYFISRKPTPATVTLTPTRNGVALVGSF